MAYNPSYTVGVAREAARKLAKQQCLLVAINPQTGSYIGASYGETGHLCDEAGELLEVACKAIEHHIKLRRQSPTE